MPYTSGLLISFCAAAFVFTAAAQESPKAQFTARELFYSASQTPAAPAAAPAPKAPAPIKKKAATAVASDKPKASAPAPTTPAAAPAQASLPDGARIIQAAATVQTTAPAPSAGPALGLRYTVLKLSGGEMNEVTPDTVFHSGDRIQFNVETNGPGYLYIVSQGSSGTWKPMFPSAEIADGNNHIDGFRPYTMPPKSRFVFDEQAGVEKLFIVFSRQPEPNLENVIYSLQAPKAQPASQPRAVPPLKPLTMTASIDDGVVGRLRNSYARDLIIEKVDENTPGDKKEKAVYVVNPSGGDDSRVVADLHLVHR